MTQGPATDAEARRRAVATMLEARSVAVVGASVKRGSLGEQMMLELRRGGFDGEVYPVNPGYEEVGGYRCYPSIGEAPGPVDLAVLGVASHRVEAALRDAAAAGARSATTFASLHEDPGDRDPGVPPLPERITAIAREAGMALCGGNGMGFLNLERGLRATGFPTPDEMPPGPVTFLSQSGSAFAAVCFAARGIRYNLIVSSGHELVTGAADYLEYALDRPTTRVIGMFLEAIREPEPFRAALERAREQDVALVALKVGLTSEAKEMVTAHSGALAGEDGAFEALFDAYDVLRVRTLDEMADALELLACPRRAARGGLATVHDSGGERVLAVDVAADLGVPFGEISEGTRARIQDALDPGLEAANPLDAWGTGIDHERIFIECLHALHDDPDVGALALAVDMTRQGEPYDVGYLRIAKEVFASTGKPFAILSNLAATVDQAEARMLRDAGIPVLEGTVPGLTAFRLLFELRDRRVPGPGRPPDPPPPPVRDRWRARLSSGEELDELAGLELLADYGVPTVASEAASTEKEAVAAAERIGWPVALKTAAPGVTHKSDVDGVRLGLGSARELTEAYRDVAGRLGPRVAVAAMAPTGVELALGVVRDPQFGPLVLVAAGGILVELISDRRLALPPLDETRARALVDRLQVRPSLDGVRGAAPSDVGAVASALSRLSVLARELGEHFEALDANPVIAGPDGCVAVDALVVPRRR